MSESGGGVDSPSTVNEAVLKDQIEVCDEIVANIVNSHRDTVTEVSDNDPVEQANELYDRVKVYSERAFDDRFQAAALYDVLKSLFREIARECGYEDKLWYSSRGREKLADGIDNTCYWFKLYTAVVLQEQPELTYEWAVSHFKEHREETVSHPSSVEPLREGPDPTLVSSLVPLWYTLEDVLRLWRRLHDMEESDRANREEILRGGSLPDSLEAPYCYGFVYDLKHIPDDDEQDDFGLIRDFRTGHEGDLVRFSVDQVDFFPSSGDVVQYRKQEDSHTKVEDKVSMVE